MTVAVDRLTGLPLLVVLGTHAIQKAQHPDDSYSTFERDPATTAGHPRRARRPIRPHARAPLAR